MASLEHRHVQNIDKDQFELQTVLRGLSEPARLTIETLTAFAPEPATFDFAAANAVLLGDCASLNLLVTKGLLRQEMEGSFVLPQRVAALLQPRLSKEASQRHRDYYLALLKANLEDAGLMKGAYGQIQRAWATAERIAEKLELLETLQPYHLQRNLVAESLVWAEHIIEQTQKENNPLCLSAALIQSGLAYENLGKYQLALERYQRALPFIEEAEDASRMADLLTKIGLTYYYQGQKEQALDYWQQVVPIVKDEGDALALGEAHYNVGLVLFRLGRLEQARNAFEHARSLLEAEGSSILIGILLHNLGLVYRALGQLGEALRYCNQALPILEERKHWHEVAVLLRNLGRIHERLGQLAEAQEHYYRALTIAQATENRSVRLRTLYSLTILYVRRGRLVEVAVQLGNLVRRLVRRPTT